MDEPGPFDEAGMPPGDTPPVDLPLEDLRRAWAGIEPPRPDAELAEEDPRTRAAVTWMQQAWSQVEAPAPVLPLALRRTRWQRWVAPLAVAAGVLLALGAYLTLQRLGLGARPGGMDTEIASTPQAGPSSADGPATQRIDGDVELAALAPDRVELRSGPVRLILLTGEDSPRTQEN